MSIECILEFNKEKNMPSFDEVYKLYYEKITRYIAKKIENYHDAQDVASDVFIYCYSHYEDYDSEKSSLGTWIYLVANSRIKNYYRDNRIMFPIDALDSVLRDDQIDMDACVYLEQVHTQLGAAIASLPDRQRQAIILRYFENRSGTEIADRLGTTAGNARVILNRALKELEKKCAGLLEGRN